MKKTYRDLSPNYSVCEHSDCPLAATCLHQLAYIQLIETENILHLINPRYCTKDAKCKYYRSNAPVRYARGFTNFQNKMFPQQYQQFMAKCVGHWSRNPYFERRRGDRPLPPDEQAFILNALKEVGVTEELQFDNYEDMTNWYDLFHPVISIKYWSNPMQVLR